MDKGKKTSIKTELAAKLNDHFLSKKLSQRKARCLFFATSNQENDQLPRDYRSVQKDVSPAVEKKSLSQRTIRQISQEEAHKIMTLRQNTTRYS